MRLAVLDPVALAAREGAEARAREQHAARVRERVAKETEEREAAQRDRLAKRRAGIDDGGGRFERDLVIADRPVA